jgi:phosphate:Na+ symporter
VAQYRRSRRDEVLGLAASGEVEPGDALERLEGLRWLDRVVYHVWRSVHHLAAPGEAVADQATEVYAEREL